MSKPWPWPEDTAEDKAKRVARSYRGLVRRIAQNDCHDPAADLARLDEHWQEHGIYWTAPSAVPFDADDWLSAADVVVTFAHFVTLTENQVRQWAYMKRKGGDGITEQPGPDGKPRYQAGDVMAYLVRQRRRRRQRSGT